MSRWLFFSFTSKSSEMLILCSFPSIMKLSQGCGYAHHSGFPNGGALRRAVRVRQQPLDTKFMFLWFSLLWQLPIRSNHMMN
jgi:hypothetical protein